MKKIIYLFMVLLTISFANPLEFKTLKGDFIQTITSDGSKIEYKGNFITTNELAFWHYNSPAKKDIYINKERAVMIEPDLEQVVITSLKEVPNLTEMLNKATKKGENIYEAEFENVTYKVELKNNLLSKISYKDNLDNHVIIDINNLKKDEVVDSVDLMPIIPNDYDVIYNN